MSSDPPWSSCFRHSTLTPAVRTVQVRQLNLCIRNFQMLPKSLSTPLRLREINPLRSLFPYGRSTISWDNSLVLHCESPSAHTWTFVVQMFLTLLITLPSSKVFVLKLAQFPRKKWLFEAEIVPVLSFCNETKTVTPPPPPPPPFTRYSYIKK